MDQAVRYIGSVGFGVFVFGFVCRAWRAEPALVKALVNALVSFRRLVFRDLAPEMLDAFVMKRLRGPHENIVSAAFRIESEIREHSFQLTRDIVSLSLRRAALALGSALYVDAVFVGAGQEIDVKPALLLIPVNGVRHYGCIQMAEVRQAIRVIDRGCDVKRLHSKT